jgi:hypothetical protein
LIDALAIAEFRRLGGVAFDSHLHDYAVQSGLVDLDPSHFSLQRLKQKLVQLFIHFCLLTISQRYKAIDYTLIEQPKMTSQRRRENAVEISMPAEPHATLKLRIREVNAVAYSHITSGYTPHKHHDPTTDN